MDLGEHDRHRDRAGRVPLEHGGRLAARQDVRSPRHAARLSDHQLPHGPLHAVAPAHRHTRPGEPSGRPHAAVLAGAQGLAAHRGPRRLLRPAQARGQQGAVDAVQLRRARPAGRQAARDRGGPAGGGQPALLEEGRRGLLPARGPERLPGGHAGLGQVRLLLPDHQVRLHTHLRRGLGHLSVHEPHQRRHHLRHGAARAHLGHRGREPQGPGALGHHRRGEHRAVRVEHAEQRRAGLQDGEPLEPARSRSAVRQPLQRALRRRQLRRGGQGGGVGAARHPAHAAGHSALHPGAHPARPDLAAAAVLWHSARPGQAEQVRVDRAVQARDSAGQEAAAGEVAQGGEAGGERGAGRSDQDHRRHAGLVGVFARRGAHEGHPVLHRDRPEPEDHPVRQEGAVHARLHLLAALHHAHESRAWSAVCAVARQRGRWTARRPESDRRRVHGVQFDSAVHVVLVGRVEE